MNSASLPPGVYTVLGGEAPDERRAMFRVMGDRLDPTVITRLTGLDPDVAHRKGDPNRSASGREFSPRRSGLWSISSEPALSRTGTTMEQHLSSLLDRLDPCADALKKLVTQLDLTLDFYCGYFMHQSNSGWGLSPQTRARIVALDATLGFDVYGPDRDDADRTETIE